MRTALVTVTPPPPFIELDAAKQHLRIDTADDDDLITAMITAVCGALDGPDGTLKRAICQQTLKLVLPGFHVEGRFGGFSHYADHRQRHHGIRIELPLPPSIDITGITYFDSSNSAQTLSSDSYSLIECGTSPSFVIPSIGNCWPSTAHRPDAVSITFEAGFDDDTPVPGPIIAAAKLMLGDLYLNREATVFSAGTALENPAVKALLSPWRILKL